eukprot:scaffold7219_cov540-Prasinococcus_capsulatus_cf.AAC.6
MEPMRRQAAQQVARKYSWIALPCIQTGLQHTTSWHSEIFSFSEGSSSDMRSNVHFERCSIVGIAIP